MVFRRPVTIGVTLYSVGEAVPDDVDVRKLRMWWNAQRIELAHFVPPVGPKLAGPVDRAMMIRDAVEALDQGDATLFTQSGKPTVQAVELVLGFDITADERDEAYEANRANQEKG